MVDITEDFICDAVSGLLLGAMIAFLTEGIVYGTLVALHEDVPVLWWVWTQEFLLPFLDTRVSDSLQALEECGVDVSFYAPVLQDVESFLEILFC